MTGDGGGGEKKERWRGRHDRRWGGGGEKGEVERET